MLILVVSASTTTVEINDTEELNSRKLICNQISSQLIAIFKPKLQKYTGLSFFKCDFVVVAVSEGN